MSSRYLITGGYLASMDEALGDFPHGAVLVNGSAIEAVGNAADFAGVDAEVIDATDGMIIPGMIDTHRHTCSAILRNIAADDSLLGLINNAFARYFPPMTAEDLYTTVLIGALEALDCGVTTILDCSETCRTFEHASANMQALTESGIRAFFGFGMSGEDYPGVESGRASHQARLDDVVRLQKSDANLVRISLGLSHGGTVPFSWWAREIRTAQEHGMLCASHETPIKFSIMNGGMRERADHGLLLPGHVYIHCTGLSDLEWRLVADTGGKVSIAPETEMQMAQGIPPFEACIRNGVPISISTDTIHAGSPDLLSQMRLGLQMQRCLDNEVELNRGVLPMRIKLTVRDALTWGTRNGADALGMAGEVGTLTPGKKADVVVISTKRAFVPSAYPLGTVVLHSTGADVDTVLVDGTVRKRDGKLVGYDLDAIRGRAHAAFGRIMDGIAKMPGEATDAELQEIFEMTERTASINFAEAYTNGMPTSVTGRSTWRSDGTA